MDTFEIRDEEINVEEIMCKIRENIKRRKESGAYQKSEIQRDLDYINSNWDIQNNSYFISTHRPIAGKVLVKGRELVNDEVRRYVDPVFWKQREFNGSVARILNDTERAISEISIELENITVNKGWSEIGNKVDEQIGLAKSEIGTKVDEQIGLAKSEIGTKVDEQIGLAKSEICNEIATQVRSVVATMNQEIENRAWLANILDKKIRNNQDIEASLSSQESGLNYFLFEERFRGSRADIKQRQTAFVHYFEGCKNVLDVGCGRGEFLELLRENGIGGHGVDVDGNMVDFCTSKGLNVEKIDAISYLEKIDDKSLDGILLDQVVEHLDPNYLIKMLRLCHEKLNFGYHVLIQTVNPLSFVSFANFYLDLSHKKPIHPETLKFLMASVNFREIETRFFSPIPDEMRLRKINAEGTEEGNKQLIEVYNYNINMLNNILYGAQDYMVIGKK